MTASAEGPLPDEVLLRRRAQALARTQAEVTRRDALTEVLVVRAGGTRYVLPLVDLTTVLLVQHISPVPGAPPMLAGLAHLQGQVVSVVSLAVLLGHGPEPIAATVLVDVGGEPMALGVAALERVVALDLGQLQPPPPGLLGQAPRVVEGTLPGGLVLLNVKDLVRDLTQGSREDEHVEPQD